MYSSCDKKTFDFDLILIDQWKPCLSKDVVKHSRVVFIKAHRSKKFYNREQKCNLISPGSPSLFQSFFPPVWCLVNMTQIWKAEGIWRDADEPVWSLWIIPQRIHSLLHFTEKHLQTENLLARTPNGLTDVPKREILLLYTDVHLLRQTFCIVGSEETQQLP